MDERERVARLLYAAYCEADCDYREWDQLPAKNRDAWRFCAEMAIADLKPIAPKQIQDRHITE